MIFALAGLFACAAFAEEGPRREFRRVNLGNGVWRVEAVPDSAKKTVPATEQGLQDTTNLQVAQWMLAEARLCMERGNVDRAGQLITWASSMEVDWDRRQPAAEQLSTGLQALELQLNYARLAAGSSETMPLRHDTSDDQEPGLRDNERDDRSWQSLSESEAGDPLSTLRQPTETIAMQPASGEPAVVATKENAVSEFTSTSVSEAQRRLPESSHPPISVPASTPRIVAGRNSIAGSNSPVLPVNLNFYAGLVMVAFCGLLMAILLAYLLLRRMALREHEAFRIAVEEAIHGQPGPPAEAFPFRVIRPPAVVATKIDGDPARSYHNSHAADSAVAPVVCAKPETFADQKKKAEIRHRESETAMVQQIIARNVSIRRQLNGKHAA